MSNVASERVVNGIKTRVLHGKDYVEVAERVRIAHTGDAQFEQVSTEQFNIENRWFVRCMISVNSRRFIGTAEIKFTAPKNTPDGTNPFECAETSALGRALAFAGLGTVESIASFDEVYRVQSIEDAEMNGRPVIEAAKPKQIAAPVVEQYAHVTKTPVLASPKGQSTALLRMIEQAQKRVEKLGLVWEDAKQQALSETLADDQLEMKHFAFINSKITDLERQGQAVGVGK